MTLASYDAMASAALAGSVQRWPFFKAGVTAEAAGNWVSLGAAAGSPGALADPTVWANCTSVAGSINFTNVSPSVRHGLSVTACASQDGGLLIYDRLGHIGSVSLASTGDKTVTSSALPRSMTTTDLNEVECWLEVTTATTVTAPVVYLKSYTSESGATAHAGAQLTFPSTATDVRWMSPLPLQAGDKGVQAIATLNVVTAATVGVCNVILLRRILYIPLRANVPNYINLALDQPHLKRIYDGSSLCMAYFASTTTAANVWGEITTVYG